MMTSVFCFFSIMPTRKPKDSCLTLGYTASNGSHMLTPHYTVCIQMLTETDTIKKCLFARIRPCLTC